MVKRKAPVAAEQMELEELLASLEDLDLLDAALLADEDEEDDELPADAALAGGFRATLQFPPRPYQEEALAAWKAAGGRGVVVLPTGAGKTVLALMTVAELKLRTLVVVPTIELLYQWRDAMVEKLGVPAAKVGVIGDGLRQLRPITVITYASAAMPESPIDGFGLLICDEAHHLPSASYSEIARRANTPYRLGLTATPERSDGLHRALDKLLGPEVYRRAPADLAAEGHIAQFKEQRIFVDLTPEELVRYETLMTTWKWYLSAHRHTLAKGGDFFGELIRRAGNDPKARQALQAHHQARMIALNAERKLAEVAKLLEAHRADKVIVFSEYNALVGTLSRQFALPSITYKTAADERKAILDGFRNGALSKLVTGRVLNEGVDVPDANVAIVVSGSSTAREYIQRLGRVLRKKPTEALLYEVITRNTTEVKTARKRRQAAA
ncbi:MAG TPA: DEAD/DEAH box helicase [Herpetosiphonaceae bacterium]